MNPKRGLWGRLGQRLKEDQGQDRRLHRHASPWARKIDEDTLDELEEVLVTADLGVQTSLKLIEQLRGKVARRELDNAEALKKALAKGITEVLDEAPRAAGAQPQPPRDHGGGGQRGWARPPASASWPTTSRGPGPFGASGRRRHLPGGGQRAAHLSGASGWAATSWAARKGPILRRCAYDAVEAAHHPGARPGAHPTPPDACTPRSTSWMSSRRSTGCWAKSCPARPMR